MNIFCMKILWKFLGVITNWTIFRGHFNAFYVHFLMSKYRMWVFFEVAKYSNIFMGSSKCLIFFGANGRCWGPRLRMRKNESTPPPPPPRIPSSYYSGEVTLMAFAKYQHVPTSYWLFHLYFQGNSYRRARKILV